MRGPFRLKQGCLAVDFGDPANAPAGDFNGFARDEKPDVGCYEYGSPSGISDCQFPVADFPVLPNPVKLNTINDLRSTINDLRIYNIEGHDIRKQDTIKPGIHLVVSPEKQWIRKITVIK